MLYTNLNHIETATDYHQVIAKNNQVVIVCGRMGEFSIPVYRVLETLQSEFPNVKFFDMEFDNPESKFLCALFDDEKEITVPYIVYYRNGEMVHHTSGSQTREQMAEKLDELFLIEVSLK